MTQRKTIRSEVPEPPRGFRVVHWMGPGFLWMVSSVGSGSVLFTPRIGAKYTYTLLWLGLIVCFLMWVMIREAGRYSVITGRSLLEGFHALPGPRGWAVWLIFVPQWFAAVAGVAGLAALVGSALMVGFSGNHAVWTVGVLVVSTTLVVTGQYQVVERVSQILAFILIGLAVTAAVKVIPGPGPLVAGLKPQLPADPDWSFIAPWVGTILAGSMGILWFSYWAATRGFGGGVIGFDERIEQPDRARPEPDSEMVTPAHRIQAVERLRRWNRVLSWTAALGVMTGAVVMVAFLTLGSELLAPEGRIPEGMDVARDLSQLFSKVWGAVGFWMLIVATIIALGGSILANQDGWGRSFADMTIILTRRKRNGETKRKDEAYEGRTPVTWFERLNQHLPFNLTRRRNLKICYMVTLTGVGPLILYWFVRDPVIIMSVSGLVAAAHTPLIVVLILFVNYRQLPRELGPSRWMLSCLGFAGVFYAAVSAIQLLQYFGLI